MNWWMVGGLFFFSPELRIQMRRVDPHFGKVLGMGFPDGQNVPRPCTNILLPTRGSLRLSRTFFAGFWGLGLGLRVWTMDFGAGWPLWALTLV